MSDATPSAAPTAANETLAVHAAEAEILAETDNFRQRVMIARIALCVGALAIWQGAVSGGLIDPLWVSSPFLVARELWQLTVSGELLADVWMTVSEALIAFVVSSALGIVSGLLLARSPFWDDVMAPIIV